MAGLRVVSWASPSVPGGAFHVGYSGGSPFIYEVLWVARSEVSFSAALAVAFVLGTEKWPNADQECEGGFQQVHGGTVGDRHDMYILWYAHQRWGGEEEMPPCRQFRERESSSVVGKFRQRS